ncbi:MAG: hypothetical protein NVSMB18_33460 [Acetobacteraceae bacterium]
MNRARAALLATLAAAPLSIALAAAPVVVNQLGRAFSVRDLTIKRGDVVRFSNIDEFLHQIYIRSPNFTFSSTEQERGQNVDVQFPTAGRFDVRCEIHPRMLLAVTVE